MATALAPLPPATLLAPQHSIEVGMRDLLGRAPLPDSGQMLRELRTVLQQARTARHEAFMHGGAAGDVMFGNSLDTDCLLCGLLDMAQRRVYPVANPTLADRFAVLAVGGYGRGELAPHSDIDLLFILPYKTTSRCEQIIEFALYKLWDLGFKVGHAVRTPKEALRAASDDLSVLTALLERRFLWGDRELFTTFERLVHGDLLTRTGLNFVTAKLDERDERHRKHGDSRYLLEPNIKEGKGGLRDLHTLQWIGRFLNSADNLRDLVNHGVLDARSYNTFIRARDFLWTVRCHLHYLTDRPEERLTFDVQPEIATRMGYDQRPGKRGVERFMQDYYRTAKEVGALTRIFCAALDERHRRDTWLDRARRPFLRAERIGDFVIHNDRVDIADETLFRQTPSAMLTLFHLAQERGLDVHPNALLAVTQNLPRLDATIRADPSANAALVAMITSPNDPAITLRRLNDAGVLGKMLPEFARIVGQMQYDLYHIYTVDEHSIFAVGELTRIERGQLSHELPLASGIIGHVVSRDDLFLASLFHDIGKGRSIDHSRLGERIVRRMCPRLGLTPERTETITWLVRYHLLLSDTAFRRDLDDPKTIQDVAGIVQSPERLRLLLALTVADIRAVGPNVWNGWKGQLLRALFYAVEAKLTGQEHGTRSKRMASAIDRLRQDLADWDEGALDHYIDRHDSRYWYNFPPQAYAEHARLIRQAEQDRQLVATRFAVDEFRDKTELLLYAPDHPGLFYRVCGALALSGVSIVGARIFTTSDGMALDSFEIQSNLGQEAVSEASRLERIRFNIERSLAGEIWLDKALSEARFLPTRVTMFTVEPRVLIDNQASRHNTVIEVNGRDRTGLLYYLTRSLFNLGLMIQTAHISTYGERVVDVFYVRDVFGHKITAPDKIARIKNRLLPVLRCE